MTLLMRVGGCLSSHWRRWQEIGAETWVVTVLRDGYRVPFKDSSPPLARTPVSFPTYRAGSPRAQALRQEVEAMLAKGALEIARDPGPGFYSRLFLVEKATGGWEACDRSLAFERLRPADAVQDGNSRFGAVVCHRGGFSSFLGSEGCVLSDPDPWIIEEAVEVHVGGDSLPVQSPVLRSVDCSPGLYQSLRGGVGLGSRSRYPTAPLPGRLVGPLLLGEEGQGVDQGAPLALSHPRDCVKREEVGSRALAVCEVSRYDHRYRCRQGLPVSSKSREVPCGSGEILFHAISPSSALAGDLGSPGFAGAVGSSRSTSDALLAVASEVPVVPRVRPSLASGGFAGGSETGPLWPEKEWFADLLLLLTQPPLVLPCWDRLLRQPHCNLFHQGAHALNLHAWRLSSDTTESRAFREGLRESCQGSSENLPLACTSRDGRSSVVGVVEGALLQSTPLFL